MTPTQLTGLTMASAGWAKMSPRVKWIMARSLAIGEAEGGGRSAPGPVRLPRSCWTPPPDASRRQAMRGARAASSGFAGTRGKLQEKKAGPAQGGTRNRPRSAGGRGPLC